VLDLDFEEVDWTQPQNEDVGTLGIVLKVFAKILLGQIVKINYYNF
jgi:hypothetical protein